MAVNFEVIGIKRKSRRDITDVCFFINITITYVDLSKQMFD